MAVPAEVPELEVLLKYFATQHFGDPLLSQVLYYCDVPSLVNACIVTRKGFKKCVFISLKHRSGIYSTMALKNENLSLIQVRMLIIRNDFITTNSIPVQETVKMQKVYDETNSVSGNFTVIITGKLMKVMMRKVRS